MNHLTRNEGTADGPVKGSMATIAFDALKWRYAGAILQSGAQFAIGIALVRLLTPEAFGIVGMALIAIGFARLVADSGFGAAVIQYPDLTQWHIRAAFTGSLLMGLLLFVGVWFVAPAISRIFAEDGLVLMLRVLGISLAVSGISVVSVSLLRRQLRFRMLTLIETFSYILGFGVIGLSMALSGYGAWSLIAANIVQPICLVTCALAFGRQPFLPSFTFQQYRELSRVASAEILNNLTNYVAENLHSFVIGKWLGTAALGLFNRSFYLMHLPAMHFSVALGSVMFPLYAKVQEDIPRLGRAFLHTVSVTALITVPVFLAMAAAAETVIGGLFGDQWKAAAATFQILCLCGPFIAMIRVFGAVSHARGFVFSEWGRQVIYFGFMGLLLWLLFPLGLEGVALALAAGVVARYLLLAHLSVKLTGVSWRQFLTVQVPGCLLALPVIAAVYLASTVGRMFLTSDFLQLLIVVAFAVASLTVSCLLFPASWLGEVYPWLAGRFGANLPKRFREFVTAKLSTAHIDVALRK